MKRVLLQAGHVAPREPGFESGTGTTREQELALLIRAKLARLLRADGRFDVTLAPGDVPDGWEGDLFLALHGDGASNRRASGYCYGFPPDSLASESFTRLLAEEYERIDGHPPHRKDNYTGGLRSYYGWRRVNAPVKVLVEHGFLTNPVEAEWMFANVPRIADAHYRAVCRLYGWKPRYKATPPKKPTVNPTVTTSTPSFTATTSTGAGSYRIDVQAGNVILKDQDPGNPVVQGRVRRLLARFPSVQIVWKRKQL